jgi:lipid-binding SYLF domain-containing protein
MRRAQAIGIFPAAPAEAIVREGSGVVTGKSVSTGRWLPAVVSFKATVRVAPGRRVGDIFIVALTRRGFDRLAQSTFSLPSLPRDTEIPPGPVGLNTTENMKTDFVAYARYRRFFAGITIERVAIKEDAVALHDLYGANLGVHEILRGRVPHAPLAALDWRQHIDAYFRELN